MLVLLPRLFILLLLLLPLSLSTNIKFTPGDNSGAGEVSPQHEPPRTNAISTSSFATRFAHRSGHMLTRSSLLLRFASFSAASAPRSQKYWTENNIERPSYAKTDAEVYLERVEVFKDFMYGLLSPKLVVGLIGIFLIVYYENNRSNNASRLGGTSSSSVDARDARLKRFETKDVSDSEKKTYQQIMKEAKEKTN